MKAGAVQKTPARMSPEVGPMPVQSTCSILDCGRPHYARSWCTLHYRRWQRHGDMLSHPRRVQQTVERRFWSNIDMTGGPAACWPWTGSRRDAGYGRLGIRTRTAQVTHLALEFAGHPRPQELFAIHSCDNPPCVNPAHLRWGTQLENMADKIARGHDTAGERNGSAILGVEEVRAIRAAYSRGGVTQYELAEDFGVSQSTVGQIVRRGLWKSVTP